ncbi:probable protein phosphatase 2C 47 [Tanacetum coccineum]|uniref:Probable protein phosphatase 2C 47 n=1 Tax=Tanacetum coccineum TaxID=301880 RepID=A0ABQ4WDL4_9ASTR
MRTMSSLTEKQTESNIMCSLEFNIRFDVVVLRRSIRSGSHKDIGARRSNEDQHIRIDDVSKQLGPEAASYVKDHVTRLFFEDSDLRQAQSEGLLDELFLKELQECQCKAFLEADQALLAEEECSIIDYYGTTALTVLILGRHLLIANVGDCRAVISRKGVAKQISHDHRPSNLQEKKRVEELGGYFADGYLNGELAVTRSLGDRHMKSPIGSFNEEVVGLVRRQLIQHNDPERCARELIDQALRLHTSDNLTAIVVCFSSQIKAPRPWRPKFRRSVYMIIKTESLSGSLAHLHACDGVDNSLEIMTG